MTRKFNKPSDLTAPDEDPADSPLGANRPSHPATDAIERTEGICGNRACIAGTRIPVWAIQTLWLQGATESEVIGAYPSLTALSLDSARAYVALNADEIRRDIEDQDLKCRPSTSW